jgi:predicted small lipoprotein YifL
MAERATGAVVRVKHWMRNWRWLSVFAVLILVLAACGQQGGQSEEPAESEPAAESEAPAPSDGGEFTGMAYPEDGPAECGSDTNASNISEIRAEDERTVVFTLCNPDVAFLAKVAFSSFAIDDSAYLRRMPRTAPSSTSRTAPARIASTRGTAARTSR